MVREAGVVSQGVHVQRRQEGLRARAFAQGQAHPEQARQDGTLFASEMGQEHGGAWPPPTTPSRASTRDFRDMLRHHRGLPCSTAPRRSFCGVMRTPKARFLQQKSYASCQQTTMWTGCSPQCRANRSERTALRRARNGIVWEEFHMPTIQAVNNPEGHTFLKHNPN